MFFSMFAPSSNFHELFSFSFLFFLLLHSVCVTQLPLGIGSSLACGLCAMSHIIKENWLFISQQQLNNNSSSASGGVACPSLPHLYWGFVSTKLMKALYMLSQLLWVRMCNYFCLWKTGFLMLPTIYGSTTFFSLSSWTLTTVYFEIF